MTGTDTRTASGTKAGAPPHDTEAEAWLLGALLLHPETVLRVMERCSAKDFYHPSNGHVFAAIVALASRGEPGDPITVADELKRTGLLDAAGGTPALIALQAAAGTNPLVYAGIIAAHATVRRLQVLGHDLANGVDLETLDRTVQLAAAEVSRARTGIGTSATGPALIPLEWERFWSKEAPEVSWLVEPLLPAGRQVAIAARAKAGKSLLFLEIAAALASGAKVLDRAASEPVNVVYIDQEMTEDDLRERLEGLGYGPESDLSALHYYLLTSLPPLDTPAGGAALLGACMLHGAQLVVLDTMARVVEGDENDSDTYRGFYRCTGRLLKAEGIAVARLDHLGKDSTRGQRGSSGKDEDVDVVFQLTAERSTITLRRTHSRIPWVPESVTLTRHEEPVLRHAVDPDAWPAGTADAAADLDTLGVPVDATVRTAMSTLKANNLGRRIAVVSAALKFRRARA